MQALHIDFTMKRSDNFDSGVLKRTLQETTKELELKIRNFYYEEAAAKGADPIFQSGHIDKVSYDVIGQGVPTYDAVLGNLKTVRAKLGTFEIISASPSFVEIGK